MPIGSRMPSWLSTMYSRGRTWRIWRSASTGMARAPSRTRSTSARVTSPPAIAATPSRRLRADVAAGDAGVDGPDLDAGHRLRALDRVLDRAHRPVDVGDDALAEAAARDVADAEDGDPVGVDLADDGAHLRRADVEADDDLALRCCSAHPTGQSHARAKRAKFGAARDRILQNSEGVFRMPEPPEGRGTGASQKPHDVPRDRVRAAALRSVSPCPFLDLGGSGSPLGWRWWRSGRGLRGRRRALGPRAVASRCDPEGRVRKVPQDHGLVAEPRALAVHRLRIRARTARRETRSCPCTRTTAVCASVRTR